MIEAFVGLIGGGKSFNAEARIAEYIASGGVICTNIEQMNYPWYNYRYADKLKRRKVKPLSEGIPFECWPMLYFDGWNYWANAEGLKNYLRRKYNWELQQGQIIDLNNDQISGALHEHLPAGTAEKPVLVVIDEAVDFFDADERSNANKEFLTFLRYSRKLCIDIIMIAQEFTELNKRIRNQVQWVWTFKDLSIERVPVLRCRYPPPYRFNIAGAQWSGRRFGGAGDEPVRLAMRWKDQSIFGCYRTEELFREVKVLRGVKTDFSSDGKTQKQGKQQMNKWERIALAASLAISIFSYTKSTGEPPSIAITAEAAQPVRPEVKKTAANMTVEQLAEALQELNEQQEPEEYMILCQYDQTGRGTIRTENEVYRIGDYHKGHQIVRIVKGGYMYMDQDGTLRTYKFMKKPKNYPDEQNIGPSARESEQRYSYNVRPAKDVARSTDNGPCTSPAAFEALTCC